MDANDFWVLLNARRMNEFLRTDTHFNDVVRGLLVQEGVGHSRTTHTEECLQQQRQQRKNNVSGDKRVKTEQPTGHSQHKGKQVQHREPSECCVDLSKRKPTAVHYHDTSAASISKKEPAKPTDINMGCGQTKSIQLSDTRSAEMNADIVMKNIEMKVDVMKTADKKIDVNKGTGVKMDVSGNSNKNVDLSKDVGPSSERETQQFEGGYSLFATVVMFCYCKFLFSSPENFIMCVIKYYHFQSANKSIGLKPESSKQPVGQLELYTK